MELQATLTFLCSLTVFSSSGAHETEPLSCDSNTQLFERLSADLKVAGECGELPPLPWSTQQTAALLMHTRNLAKLLHQHQLRECQNAEPKQCLEADVPSNGGLACVTVDNKRYCKPLCNSGFDFGFLRRSRLFDECSEQTGFRWNSQYVGGNKLAVCNEATIQVSGASSAYFPKDQDCLTTKSNSQLMNATMEAFSTELRTQGVVGDRRQYCLVCG
ncbi:uncharacterized protein PAE49_020152 [Odontesthes bonariensis]|uniref:uncharacterized protein LOC142400461 n=1 Tax=Odontesthes bonariensis TaxID=219752 RepID=UPI003F583DCC